MNAIAFATKRAFHGFLRVTRKPLASLGLTAARFDLMSAILRTHANDWMEPRGRRQSDLRRDLGVTAPVITRMARSLETLGLVTRKREACGDRRQVRVRLTEDGARCIREASQLLLRAVQRLVYLAICFGRHRDANQRFFKMDELESYLSSLRREFGDRATLYYPWGHPDD